MFNIKLASAIALIIFASALMMATTAVLGAPKGDSGVSVKGLVVYDEPKKQITSTTINWGNVSANSYVSRTFYVKNPNAFKLTLIVTASNWQPQEAESALAISCNKNNVAIPPGKTVPVTLTLQIGPNVDNLRDFSCTVTFSGVQ